MTGQRRLPFAFFGRVVGVVAVAFSAAARDPTVASVGGSARRRTGTWSSGRFPSVLPSAAGAPVGAVGSWSLLAGRHGLPILLIALVSGIDSDVALPALLVDVSVPGFGRIGLKIGTVFHIRCGARPFVGAAGGGHWRQILFRHVVVSVFALFGQNSGRFAWFRSPRVKKAGCNQRRYRGS